MPKIKDKHPRKRVRANPEKVKAYQAKWYRENIEKRKVSMAKWLNENQEKRKVDHAKWQKANPEKVKENHAKWVKNNPEKVKARTREWARANPEKMKTSYAKWEKNNPEIKKASMHKRRAIKLAAGGSFTAEDIKKMLKQQKGKCIVCKVDITNSYHIDHVISLILGGSNGIQNIQLLCPHCNLVKGAKHPIDFMQSMGFLL